MNHAMDDEMIEAMMPTTRCKRVAGQDNHDFGDPQKTYAVEWDGEFTYSTTEINGEYELETMFPRASGRTFERVETLRCGVRVVAQTRYRPSGYIKSYSFAGYAKSLYCSYDEDGDLASVAVLTNGTLEHLLVLRANVWFAQAVDGVTCRASARNIKLPYRPTLSQIHNAAHNL